MKLTVEAVSRMTGLTESTVRQYAWQKKLGKLEGRQKVFTLAEAKKLGGLRNAPGKAKRAKKSNVSKGKTKPQSRKATLPAGRNGQSKVEMKPPSKEAWSLWAFLGIGKKPKTKVSLMDAKIKK